MAGIIYKIIWTDGAKEDLRDIFSFIKKKSLQGAKNVVSDIRNAPKSVRFPQQNEDERYNNNYKRLIRRSYKILYRTDEEKKELVIFAVFDTRQNPVKLSDL